VELHVRFARILFRIAAIYGVMVLTPLYFMFDVIGRKDPPAITHPAFFYGFVGCALAWQVTFWVISMDPSRYRALMIPSVMEKWTYGLAVVVLVMQHRTNPGDLMFGGVDLLLGALFVAAYFKTPKT
jgi:hypothetical protein